MVSIAIIKESKEQALPLAGYLNGTGEFHVTSIYHCCEDALKGLLKNNVDIAIIDIQINDCKGIELIAKLSRQNLSTKYLVFTVNTDDESIFNALRAGANGYILKSAHLEKIKEALHELRNGGAPLSSFVASKVLNYFHPDTKTINKGLPLSVREKEILHFAARGLLYKEIALQLGIRRETVKKHLSNIYVKLQVQNKVEALNKVYSFNTTYY
jgi:NarL family two-component system response regulator LiaR